MAQDEDRRGAGSPGARGQGTGAAAAGLEELHRSLAACIESYVAAFGAEAADVQFQGSKIRVTVREEQEGKWQQRARIEIVAVITLPGFRVERAGDPLLIEVGMLAGDKLFFKDRTCSSPWRNSRAASWTAPSFPGWASNTAPRRGLPPRIRSPRSLPAGVLPPQAGHVGALRVAGVDDQPVSESQALARLHGNRPVLRFIVGKRCQAKRIGGEQSIPAHVPARGVMGVGGVVEDRDPHLLAGDLAGIVAPVRRHAPSLLLASLALRVDNVAGSMIFLEYGAQAQAERAIL